MRGDLGTKVSSELPEGHFQQLAEGVYAIYAHCPREIRNCLSHACTIAKGKVRVVFQPHLYSRTKRFMDDFSTSFDLADEVVLCPINPADEEPIEAGTTAADLYKRMRDLGRRPLLARSCDEAWEHALNSQKEGDVTIVLGSDDITSLIGKPPRPISRIYLGAGSNTWKSDLNLNVEYIKPNVPASRPGASLGIPWMAGVPGTIGGWIVMNAGAFGHSISELVECVKVDGKWLSAEECCFGYRTSKITGLVEDVKFKPFESDKKLHDEYLSRRPKFPAGTKGSVFKNPQGDFAGRLLEEAGVKGLTVGGAHVWEKHANVIVAENNAPNSDFLALALIMKDRVAHKFGVELEPEVKGLV